MGILKSDLNFINLNCILGCERCTDYFCKHIQREMKITEDINYCDDCVYKDSREESLNLIIHSVCGREISKETELVGYVCDGSKDEIVNVNENKIVSSCPYYKFISKCETCVEKCKCKDKVYACSRYKEQKKLIHLCKTCKEMGDFGCDVEGEFYFTHHIKLKENDIISECSAYKEYICDDFKPDYDDSHPSKWTKDIDDYVASKFDFVTNELRELYRLYTLKMITLDELITRVKKEVENKRAKLFELDDLHSNLVAYKQGLKELEVHGYSFLFIKKTIPAGKARKEEPKIVLDFSLDEQKEILEKVEKELIKDKQHLAFEKYIGGVPLSDEELSTFKSLRKEYKEYIKNKTSCDTTTLFIEWCKKVYFSCYYNN